MTHGTGAAWLAAGAARLAAHASASAPGTNPAIIAAWIAAGAAIVSVIASVVTSVFGSRNTLKATSQAVEAGTASTMATLAAAREDRLWDKRAAAYEETLTSLLHRQAKRRHDLRGYRWDAESEQKLADLFDSYQAPSMFEMQGRLVAYASEPVRDAYEASQRAHREVRVRCQQREMLADEAKTAAETGRPGMAPDGNKLVEARHAIDKALEEAEVMDEALVKVIRDELRSRPEAAAPRQQ